MTTESIPRVERGVPAGGQFAATVHAESPVRLFDRNDGSFFKPSPSSTADHCIQFWSTVEIPDGIINQAEIEYAKLRSAEIDGQMEAEMGEWAARWQEANPAPKRESRRQEYDETFRRDHEEYRLSILDGVVASRPEFLGSYDSRQLVRAAMMRRHRPHPAKFPGEAEKVLSHHIELFNEVLTVGQIEEKYHLTEVNYAMIELVPDNSDAAVIEVLNGIDNRLVGVHNQIVAQRADVSGY